MGVRGVAGEGRLEMCINLVKCWGEFADGASWHVGRVGMWGESWLGLGRLEMCGNLVRVGASLHMGRVCMWGELACGASWHVGRLD